MKLEDDSFLFELILADFQGRLLLVSRVYFVCWRNDDLMIVVDVCEI